MYCVVHSIEQTPDLFRRRALSAADLRPHVGPTRQTGLLVQGQDLLEWAAMSSRGYFQLRQLQESEVG